MCAEAIESGATVAQGLFRQVVECMRVEAAPRSLGSGTGQGESADEVLLELALDGMSYLLIRRPVRHERPSVTLSPREREIVRLVAKGLPSKAIADVLDVSLWTVATHLRRVFAKLGVSSRAEMVAQAMKGNLLGADILPRV